MPEEKVIQPEKKKEQVAVPETEISQAQEKTTRNYYIIMGVIIGATVIVGGYVIYRLAMAYGHSSNENRAQDIEINALLTKQKNLELLKPNYEAIIRPGANGVSDKKLIMNALPDSADYEKLIAILEKMGQESGVKVRSVSQGGDSAGSSSSTNATNQDGNSSQPQPLTFSVDIEGSYSAILEFLNKTEQSSRVINFASMDITGGSTGTATNASGAITANLTMTTYFQDPANIAPTIKPLE